jgi:hypothetical protein
VEKFGSTLASFGRTVVGLVALVLISAAIIVVCAVAAFSRLPTP